MTTLHYLDHAAGTPPYEEVLKKWHLMEKDHWANPTSVHSLGLKARSVIDESRFTVAKIFNCSPSEVIFTSGGTEAFHLGLLGYLIALRKKKDQKNFKILMSPIAHRCMQEAASCAKHRLGAQIEFLPINFQGFFEFSDLSVSYLKSFDVIALEHGNSEIGICQKVSLLGEKLQEIPLEERPHFIVDTAASIVTEKVSFLDLGCTAFFVSGEKFGGMKGSGALIHSQKKPLAPLFAGSQEFGMRGGTENLGGIFTLAQALKIHEKEKKSYREKYEDLHQYARKRIEQKNCSITTPTKNYLPHILHFSAKKGSGHSLVIRADLKGICISSGPACSSGSVKPSPVLKALGVEDRYAEKGVRISFGPDTSYADIDALLELL